MIVNRGVSIIIVNWNSKKFLTDCLSSIVSNTKNLPFEVIIVDNASYDGAFELVNGMQNVKYIQSEKNQGFSKANNIGLKQSSMDTLLFLNPDTVLQNNAIEIMHKVLWSDNDYGSVGCKLLNTDGTLQTSCVMPFPTLFNLLFDIEYLKIRTPFFPAWGISSLFKAGEGPWSVEAISGACIMTKRSVVDKIGGFSEEYFMYAEDVDLCMKIKMSGYKNMYVPSAKVIHHGGGASREKKESKFSTVLCRESMKILLTKFNGPAHGIMYRFIMVFSALLRLVLLMPFLAIHCLIRHPKRRTIMSALQKWYYILSWGMGKERWCREYS